VYVCSVQTYDYFTILCSYNVGFDSSNAVFVQYYVKFVNSELILFSGYCGFSLAAIRLYCNCLQCFDTVGWASARAFDLISARVVICRERSANDSHMVKMMPLPPQRLLLHYNPDWFNVSGAGLPWFCRKRGR